MKVAFIINPTAGKGRAAKIVPEIEKTMSDIKNVEYRLLYTEKPGHAISIAKDAASSGADIVFAVGGDGTVNEVMNGLIGTGAALAVLPCGSGNDFIRSLKISGKADKIIRNTLTTIHNIFQFLVYFLILPL
jgi:diacylglycerol kinase family enzyme